MSMKYHDLRDFIAQLERMGELKRIGVEVDPRLEMTEICDRVLRAGGPAILEVWFPGQEDGNIVAQLLFGKDSPLLAEGKVVTVQTLGGTGALKVGDLLADLRPGTIQAARRRSHAAGFDDPDETFPTAEPVHLSIIR